MLECLGVFLDFVVDPEFEIGGWRLLPCLEVLVLAALYVWWARRRHKRKEEKDSAEDSDVELSSHTAVDYDDGDDCD
tara:strand:+ start:366 stop:596 length:231 start_codon:yes stop_codon:yes gene_type:complete